MALYIDEGLFPGYSNSFKMTSIGIDREAIQKMMKSAPTYDMAEIKNVFEYFLGVSIDDCSSQLRENEEDRYSIAEIRDDYRKALAKVRKMSTADFFDAKINAQRNGILRNIVNCESRLNSGILSAEDKVRVAVCLNNYRQDLDLWDSLIPDEKLFFIVKSMTEYEHKNYSYYSNMEKTSVATSTFDALLNMSYGKRTEPVLMGDFAPEML